MSATSEGSNGGDREPLQLSGRGRSRLATSTAPGDSESETETDNGVHDSPWQYVGRGRTRQTSLTSSTTIFRLPVLRVAIRSMSSTPNPTAGPPTGQQSSCHELTQFSPSCPPARTVTTGYRSRDSSAGVRLPNRFLVRRHAIPQKTSATQSTMKAIRTPSQLSQGGAQTNANNRKTPLEIRDRRASLSRRARVLERFDSSL